MHNEKQKRRGFLKIALATITTAGLALVYKKSIPVSDGKKVKMLSPDGKLVEVDETVVMQAGANSHRASNSEVQHWMKTSKTK